MHRRSSVLSSVALLLLAAAPLSAQQRTLTFLDVLEMRSAGSWTPSPDGDWMLYTITTPDWEANEEQSDVHLVSLGEGFTSSRQMTFTEDKNESEPAWAPDGSFFAFASNRDAEESEDKSQLYLMRHDGGEARRITDSEEGVSGFSFGPDGEWLVYRSGEEGEEQLYRLPVSDLSGAEAAKITDSDAAGITDWEWSPVGAEIFFVRPDSFDEDEKHRIEEGFTVEVKNAVTPLSSLWSVKVSSGVERRLTEDPTFSVDAFTVSDDGRWVAFTGGSPQRYERNITAAGLYSDQYLLELASGHIERLTDNYEVRETLPIFSPDGRWIAFSAPDDMDGYSMTEDRLYVREISDRGGDFRELGSSFDNSPRDAFWADDSRTIYFNAGVAVTNQLHAVDVESGEVRQITTERASLAVSREDDSGTILIDYQDPLTPPTVFTAESMDLIDDRTTWTQLVDPNPQVRDIALGRKVEMNWTSTDGKTVGGVLVYPVGYQEGTRYPLVVQIHGGPASADVLNFNSNRGEQVYAGAGYVVLKPNYRGSRNYGNSHRVDIVGDYFRLGYDDIMTGVDHLIDQGIVDEEQMGVFGFSAGGHWSNWILTQTDRFKAISSGAGTMNWISMYAQSDVQRNRRFYLGDEHLYENPDPFWDQSPLKYISNARTPTMIHVGADDPRVPSPQSLELHMALKKLGVPTELFMYPGAIHGIEGRRNQLAYRVSEMAWMDHYVRGIGEKFEWRQVLETLEDEDASAVSDDP